MNNTIKKQIQTLHNSGMSISEIADAVGYSKSYVYNIANDFCDAGSGFRKSFRQTYAVITTNSIRQARELHNENKELQRQVLELETKLENIYAIISK